MITILQGDCRTRLQEIEAGTFHTCVTSPPYWGLRDYGLPPSTWGDEECSHEWGEESMTSVGRNDESAAELQRRYEEGHRRSPASKATNEPTTASTGQFCRLCNAWRGCLGLEPTPDLYVAHIVEVFREVRRVLRDDGTCWLNLGDSYATGSKGTAEGMIPQDWIENGTTKKGGMTRAGCPPGLKPKDLCGIPWRVAFALQAEGWWLRSDIIWHKTNCMPESVTDRPTKSHEYLFLLSKSARYFFDQDAVREEVKSNFRQREKNNGESAVDTKMRGSSGCCGVESSGRNIRTVWTIPTSPYKEAHFATFPPALVEPCIKAGTSERGCCPECGKSWERVVKKAPWIMPDGKCGCGVTHGTNKSGNDAYVQGAQSMARNGRSYCAQSTTIGWIPRCECDVPGAPEHAQPFPYEPVPCKVLDPFFGAGTVGLVSDRLGRDCTGIELNGEYVEMAEKRITDDAPMFAEVEVS